MKWVRKEVEHDPDWLEYHCHYENCLGKVFRNSYGDWRIIIYTDTDTNPKRVSLVEVFDSLEEAIEFAEEILVSEAQEPNSRLPDLSTITTKVK